MNADDNKEFLPPPPFLFEVKREGSAVRPSYESDDVITLVDSVDALEPVVRRPPRPEPIEIASSDTDDETAGHGAPQIDGVEILTTSGRANRAEAEEEVVLSQEQHDAVRRALQGESLFITGSAGCGKSVVIRTIARLMSQRPALTALTGLAALQIGGCTIHSWTGIGVYKPTDEFGYILRKAGRAAANRWKQFNTLIVDEISMADDLFIDMIDRVGRHFRDDPRPFGGIQIILCGDFLQLAPIGYGSGYRTQLAFQSKAWMRLQQCGMHTVFLRQNFRQQGPGALLANLLATIRLGTLTPEAARLLNETSKGHDSTPEHVRLRPTKAEVNEFNDRQFNLLTGPIYEFRSYDTPDERGSEWPVDALLRLKVGTRVMLRRNVDRTLVNGSCGEVTGFRTLEQMQHLLLDSDQIASLRAMKATHCPVVHFDRQSRPVLVMPETFEERDAQRGRVRSRLQIPLSYAWAMTIHKAQGMTLEKVDIKLERTFAAGQAYVALSRGKTLEGLHVVGLTESVVQANQQAKGFYLGLEDWLQRTRQPGTDGRDRVRHLAAMVSDLDQREADAPLPLISDFVRQSMNLVTNASSSP